MVEPELELRNMLRTRLTDPNSSRVAGTPYVVDSWPYQTDLTTNHFPRISVIPQFESNKSFGLNSTNFWSTYRLQIDCWIKPDQPLIINSSTYEGVNQIIKISRDVETAIKTYWITDLALTNKFIILTSYNTYAPHYDYDYNFWRRTADLTLANKT